MNRFKQIFLYVAPFPALVFFKIWASTQRSPESLLIVSAIMLAYCALVILLARSWDKPSYFDWTIAIYFCVVTAALLFVPRSAAWVLSRYGVTGIYVCLFAAAFAPPLLGFPPFTYHYAKKMAPKDVWENPIFITVNRIMTDVWAGLFALCALISLYPSVVTRAIIPIALIMGFGVPFNIRFPDYYLKRLGLPGLKEQREMARSGKPLGEKKAKPSLLPSTAWEAVSKMPLAFNPQAAGELSAIMRYEVTGDEEFTGHIVIDKGTCSFSQEEPGKPDLVIKTPADVWLSVARKERNGQQAFMKQEFKAEGNLGLLMRMSSLFSGAGGDQPAARPNLKSNGDEVSVPQNHSDNTSDNTSNRKEKAMKALALNSSPRGSGQSKTEVMLNALVKGMREAGAEVEIVNLRDKTIRYCSGCFTCWTKTPGVCIHKDDMTKELFPKYMESDIAILATPLYHFTVNANMKAFIERTLPMLQPFFEQKGDKTTHPLRAMPPRTVMISVAGFPEQSVFDLLSSWVKFIFRGGLVAEIYRSGAEGLFNARVDETLRAEVLSAVERAGRELVESGKIEPATMEKITTPLPDAGKTHKIGNLFWKTCIAEGVTPKEFDEKGMALRPDSLESFMLVMPMGFNAQKAGDTKATLQFVFSGEVEGSCSLHIENGTIKAQEGMAQNPDLTIETPFDLWMDIMTRKADGQQAFMEGKYKVKGDLSLLMRMNQLFGK